MKNKEVVEKSSEELFEEKIINASNKIKEVIDEVHKKIV
jgi:hypothetical protein